MKDTDHGAPPEPKGNYRPLTDTVDQERVINAIVRTLNTVVPGAAPPATEFGPRYDSRPTQPKE
jgi:hypothetical protein